MPALKWYTAINSFYLFHLVILFSMSEETLMCGITGCCIGVIGIIWCLHAHISFQILRNVFLNAENQIRTLNSKLYKILNSKTYLSTRVSNNDYERVLCSISDILLRRLWFKKKKNREIRTALRIWNISLRKAKVSYFWNANLAIKRSPCQFYPSGKEKT